MTQTESKKKLRAEPARREGADREPLARAGNWELVQLAAEGTWAQVYRARPADSPSDRTAAYAVKMLRPQHQDAPEAAELLAREALVGRSVAHPHLVAILDSQIGRRPQFLVMPWLEGSTLHARLQESQPLDPPLALWIARQTAEALAALDEAGWMHGDIKPSNIFLSPEGHATLLDLGFARRRDENSAPNGRTIQGTGYYLAPECFTDSLAPDIRSDIYSLGAVLYQLLSGRLPLEGRSLAELAVEHKQTTPASLRRLVPQLSPEAARLVHRILAKDPLRRPQTPQELVAELVRLEIATFTERAA